MCGIAGWIGQGASEQAVVAMVNSLQARGPDGSGVQQVSPRCVLGHSRLAIIDLSAAGAQPIPDATGRVWAVVNGEIYNYKALRRELEELGLNFRSNCDSEVVVHGFIAWGKAVVSRLRGIFAFVIYDSRDEQLLLFRDRVGVKPLYYAYYDDCLVFASELKAFRAGRVPRLEYDPISMHIYLAYRYLPAPSTPYSNVFKLEPSHLLIYKGGRVHKERYWMPSALDFSGDVQEAAHQLAGAVEESVTAQLMSDAPIGLLLSGGIDSSSVAALAASRCSSLEAFCCGFKQPTHDERVYARHAADFVGVNLHEMVMTWPLLKARLPLFIEWFDEPFFNYSAVAIHELCCMAKDRGIKVLLAGEGADEVFAGYLWYDDFAVRATREGRGALDLFFSYNGFFTGQMQDELAGRHLGFDHLEVLRRLDYPDLPPVNRAQWLDFHAFLPDDVLCRDDRASMAAGIELRVPYLDDGLLDNWFLLPQSLIYQKNERKHLLKKALSRILPPSILTNRKKGFGFPLHDWDGPIRVLAAKALQNGQLIAWGHASAESLHRMVPQLRIDYVWLLLTAELWMRRFLAGEDIAILISENE